jgi:hypothetical protein
MNWVAHWSGVVPLAVVSLAWAASLAGWGRAPTGAYWWVAAGLAVSVLADGMMKLLGGGFDVTFYYVPVQVGLVLCAFQPGLIPRALLLAFMAVAGWVSAHVTTAPAEWIISVFGGVVIAAAAFQAKTLRLPLWTYFLVGLVAYLWMIPTIVPPGSPIHPEFMARWGTYQACRWVAFGFFVLDVARQSRRPGWA